MTHDLAGVAGRAPDRIGIALELDLDRRPVGEPVRAFQHAKLEQLDGRLGRAVGGHGGQYSFGPMASPTSCRRSVSSSKGSRGYLADLERLVNIDCGSSRRREPGAGRGRGAARSGWAPPSIAPAAGGAGRTAAGRSSSSAAFRGAGRASLLIGHMDTVFEPGTAAARPFLVEGDRGMGPGVSDMKRGLLGRLWPRCRHLRNWAIVRP